MKDYEEKAFEQKLIKRLRNEGFFVRKTEVLSAPGFPDLFIGKHSKNLLLELKIAHPEKRVIDHFTDMQIPFCIEYTDHGNDNCYVVFKRENSYVIVKAETIVKNRYKKLKDIWLADISFSYLIDCIKEVC